MKDDFAPLIEMTGYPYRPSCSGVSFFPFGYDLGREPPKTNCLRCGAPISKYATDCEYCGKKQKD